MIRRLVPAAVAALLVLTGCGTRVDDATIAAQNVGRPGGAAAVPVSGDGVAPGDGATAVGPAVGAVDPAAPVQPTTNGPATGVVAPGPGAAPAASTAPGVATPAKGKPAAVGGSASATCTAALAPIRIGQVGAFSGLIGQSTGNIRQGMAAWAKDVNSRGGLACHPIQLYQQDDASDPTRTAGLTQDLIESKKVVALVGVDVPVTIAAYRSVVDRYKIPTVGGDALAVDWNQDQYLFPQGGAPLPLYVGASREMAKASGKTKMGLIYCVETTVCSTIKTALGTTEAQQQAGIQLVAQQSTSLTQTDFTSECQNMKKAGAEMLFLALDSASDTRLARSCASIGYNPPFASGAIAINSSLVKDPNINKSGLYVASPVVPYMETSLPAQKEFRKAFDTFAPGAPIDGPAMIGWTAGKLFEAAINGVAAKARSGPVTTELIFEGLYSLKNETLGDLGPGVTFKRGAPAPPSNCYYIFKLSDGAFTAPLGNKKNCF